MTTAAPTKPLTIGNDADWKILVNESRVLLRKKHKEQEETDTTIQTAVLSHAVLNGGLKLFPASQCLQILNAKVPSTYDGVNPNPKELMRQLAQKDCTYDGDDSPKVTTIGLQTAASMSSLCVATQQATGQICRRTVVVDAIVTAGISNARAAGADADFLSFSFSTPEDDSAGEENTPPKKKFGTINTIVITNAILEESSTAMVEAYAIAIEAKCRAASDLGMICAKDPSETSTGTGTDSTVLVCQQQTKQGGIEYSGKHSLLGELIGQAVYQATQGAIEKNISYFYRDFPISSLLCYRLHCYKLKLFQVLREGHRPKVPLDPMNPLPRPKTWVMLVGLLGVILAFGLHIYTMEPIHHCRQSKLYLPKPSASVLLGYFWGDRFLGAVKIPLLAHPVVMMGKLISFLLGCIPDSCFEPDQEVLGFLSGLVFFFTAVVVSVTVVWGVLLLPHLLSMQFLQDLETCATNRSWSFYIQAFVEWCLHLFAVGGAISFQLLCSIPLQMAHYLERNQLQNARNLLVWLCSRDPSNLRGDELAGGTLESLSENLSDSVVGPLVYYVALGPVGAFAFRAMNTLDSNVGYRGRYEWVGKPSARWDDLICLIPARLTAALLILAAVTLNLLRSAPNPAAVAKEATKVAWRDAGQCDSPNAGWPMATFAGILGVQLEKKGQYCLNGPKCGGNGKPPGYRDIRKGHSVAQLAGILSLLLAALASGWMHAFTNKNRISR